VTGQPVQVLFSTKGANYHISESETPHNRFTPLGIKYSMLSETPSLYSKEGVACYKPSTKANTFRSRQIERRGESWYKRLLLRIWAPITHCIICIVLTICLMCLDGKRLNPGERHSYKEIFRDGISLRVSEVTTLISIALLGLRTVGHSFTVSATWRAAMILLQHDGLNLGQLNTMISYRLPTSWTGTHAWTIALALILLLPSAFISPLLSGSVDWVAANSTDISAGSPIRAGFGLRDGVNWTGFRGKQGWWVYSQRVGLGLATHIWFDTQLGGSHWGRHRYAAWEDAPVHTIIEDVPMPFINIHSIVWESQFEPWEVDIVNDPNLVFRATPGYLMAPGNCLFFKAGHPRIPTSTPSKPVVIRDTWKVAVVVGLSSGTSCLNGTREAWDELSDHGVAIQPTLYECWVLATVNFEVGIRFFERATYVRPGVVEALPDSKNSSPNLIGDSWADCGISLLSDMMSVLPLTKLGTSLRAPSSNLTQHTKATISESFLSLIPGGNLTEYAEAESFIESYLSRTSGGSLTQHAEATIRESYLSMRAALAPYNPSKANLTAYRPISYIQANVDHQRVLIWLSLHLLLPVSALILSWVETRSTGSGQRRNPVIETALAPLLTDIRDVLGQDDSGISNMSYLTSDDTKRIGKLRLTSVKWQAQGLVLCLE